MDGHYQFNKRLNLTYDIFYYVFYISNYIRVYNFIYGYVGLFDIYSKQVRRTIMAKETVEEMLKMIDAKVEHLEDICADDRTFIIKLVKQTNEIVKFLRNLEIDANEQYEMESPLTFSEDIDRDELSEKRMLEVKELLKEFKSKSTDLKEFEEELKKHKDKLTPGQVGDA
tara:strand:+ start:147 stop:656 length:510 start_codon:yes stop_codon:yes gene_type:complete